MLDRSVYEIDLVGIGEEAAYEAVLIDVDEYNGLFTFEFLVPEMHDELYLNVKIYSYDTATERYELQHIP